MNFGSRCIPLNFQLSEEIFLNKLSNPQLVVCNKVLVYQSVVNLLRFVIPIYHRELLKIASDASGNAWEGGISIGCRESLSMHDGLGPRSTYPSSSAAGGTWFTYSCIGSTPPGPSRSTSCFLFSVCCTSSNSYARKSCPLYTLDRQSARISHADTSITGGAVRNGD